MNTTTEKKRFTTRDVMVIAAMMVLTFAVYGAVGALTLPFPFLYLYCSAGIQEFFCATFYLVVANRLNKHGILMVWSTVFGIISALSVPITPFLRMGAWVDRHPITAFPAVQLTIASVTDIFELRSCHFVAFSAPGTLDP